MRDQAKAKQSKFTFESLEEEPCEKHFRFLMRTTALVACVANGRRTRVNHALYRRFESVCNAGYCFDCL